MSLIPAFAPGCYGSALAYNADNQTCRGCQFAETCSALHADNLALLRQRLGITVSQRKPRQQTVAASQPVAFTMSPNARRLVDILDAGRYRIVERLQKGENPFDTAPFKTTVPWMRLACHLLMKMQGPMTRPTLATALTSKLGLPESTAEGHSSVVFQVLTHIGAVDTTEGAITLRRAA